MKTRTRLTVNVALVKLAERLAIGVICVLSVQLVGAAAPPVRTMYTDAFAREQTVRAAMAAADRAPSVVQDVRATIAAYESVVKRYPASSYCDNALWQAAHLSLDAFDTFGETQDKERGVRLLRKLASMYPGSKLARQVPTELRRAGADSPLAARSSSLSDQPAPRNQEPTTASQQAARASEQRGPSNEQRAVATIKGIRRLVMPNAVRVTIELDGEAAFHDERLADPVRVFVDLPATKPAPALADRTLRFEGDADIVRQVRVGRHPNNTTRVVLDAAGVGSYSVYPLYNPFRIVIDCVRPNATAASSPPAPPAAVTVQAPPPPYVMIALPGRKLTTEWLRKAPSIPSQHGVLLAEARTSAPPPTELAPNISESSHNNISELPRSSTSEPSRSTTGEPRPPLATTGGLSMARQLGLGVSRIVIDPGHGGHDPGAKGKGVGEAELVLDIALRVEKLLQKVNGVEVILTRRTDEFIPLPDRTALANRENADLFLSIHANASPNPQAHGIETYFLNFANNQTAAAVAARENAASTQAMGELPDFVKAIARNTKLEESREFATQVQRTMIDKLRGSNRTVKDLGVKQAPFVVLIGAAMPCALAEISFVTNPQEAKLMKANAYRQRIAEALFNAIRKYQTSLKNVSAVALQ
jgi:N-acetylmuramoyl-L-alanine amidase